MRVDHLRWKIFDGACVGQSIQNNDAVERISLSEEMNEIRTDKSGATSDQNSSHFMSVSGFARQFFKKSLDMQLLVNVPRW